MSGNQDERVYSVIEYLASVDQLQGKAIRVRGTLGGFSENQCYVASDGKQAEFTAEFLPEPDRVALLKGGSGVVTLGPNLGQASAVHFD